MVLKMIRKSFVAAVVLGSTLLTAQPAALAQKKAPSKVSTEADRKKVSITVYNGNFGVVREVRDLPDLGFGSVSAEEIQKVVLTILAMSFAQVSSIDQVIADIERLPADTKAGEALPGHAAGVG